MNLSLPRCLGLLFMLVLSPPVAAAAEPGVWRVLAVVDERNVGPDLSTDDTLDDDVLLGARALVGLAARAFTARFYLSSDETLDSGDVLLGARPLGSLAASTASSAISTFTVPVATTVPAAYRVALDADDVLLGARILGALGAGLSAPAISTLAVPAALATGSYRVLALADALARQVELGEADNTAVSGAVGVSPSRRGAATASPLRSADRCDNHAPMGGHANARWMSVAERLLYNPRGS